MANEYRVVKGVFEEYWGNDANFTIQEGVKKIGRELKQFNMKGISGASRKRRLGYFKSPFAFVFNMTIFFQIISMFIFSFFVILT